MHKWEEYVKRRVRVRNALDASYKSTFPITKGATGSGETEGENQLPPPANDPTPPN